MREAGHLDGQKKSFLSAGAGPPSTNERFSPKSTTKAKGAWPLLSMAIALGLMSGTSGDGVSAALVRFKNHSFRVLAYRTFPYPKKLSQQIAHAAELKAAEISQLDFLLGRIFAEAALKIIRRTRVPRKKIEVIGSHGQTLYHGPRDPLPSTFQIGESAVIAERTQIPVVSDFRPQDVACGGEGAPLIPFFDTYFYGRGPRRALLNVGGIANVTVVGRNLKSPIAFDTGPGNGLIDLAIQRITKGKLAYDPNGKWAMKGKVEMNGVRSMMRHPYFRRRPPKSTGREEFGEVFLKKYLGASLWHRPFDFLATLTYFTALTIFESLRRWAPLFTREIIVSGGGAKNRTLMKYLRELFSPLPVRSIEEWKIPAQAKEPIAFAFFALRSIRGQINHLPSATGARHATVLGKITKPHAFH